MALECGIVGLPNVGKSTIFSALTAAPAAAENFPFLEGFCSEDLDVFCVQFHPEAHGGPLDTERPIFDMMYKRIK